MASLGGSEKPGRFPVLPAYAVKSPGRRIKTWRVERAFRERLTGRSINQRGLVKNLDHDGDGVKKKKGHALM